MLDAGWVYIVQNSSGRTFQILDMQLGQRKPRWYRLLSRALSLGTTILSLRTRLIAAT